MSSKNTGQNKKKQVPLKKNFDVISYKKNLTVSMAERSGHTEAERKASGGQALVQIGHYVLGETLGIGTFGKVKGLSIGIGLINAKMISV